jgi:hypothetical protein
VSRKILVAAGVVALALAIGLLVAVRRSADAPAVASGSSDAAPRDARIAELRPVPADANADLPAARRERDEVLDRLQHSGRADEPWVGQAGALFAEIGHSASEMYVAGCYVAGCGATFTFRSLELYRSSLAKIEPTAVYREWTGGKQFTEPEVRADGTVVVALVLYRPD